MNLINQYQRWHETADLFAGKSSLKHVEYISQFIRDKNCESILDFGCGKGDQYFKDKIHEQHFRGVLPTLYDPAVEEFCTLPERTFDAVISTDVLEHIDEIDDALRTIHDKADKFVYHGVANFPTGRLLDDGRDSHVIQEDIDWWVQKVLPYAKQFTMIYLDGGDHNKSSRALIENHKVIVIK